MGESTARVRQPEKSEQEESPQGPSHSRQENARDERNTPADRGSELFRLGQAKSHGSGANPGGDGTASQQYVGYNPGPDREALSARYGMAVQEREVTRLQRLESEFGRETVTGWADEGMTVETMGKPRDMTAFRKRQKDQPEAVPNDIERQNAASVQRSTDAAQDTTAAGDTATPDAVREVISSPGSRLDEPVKQEMETKLNEQFSDVVIHTGSQAAAAADAVDARAFTVGNHIVFNDGEYQPETDSGKEVLAHELTHVRQQTEGNISMLPKADSPLVIDPDPHKEAEAEETATAVVDDETVAATRQGFGTAAHIQRLPRASSDGASGPVLQRAAAETADESNNVADTHDVSKGDTLSEIAADYGIDDWKALWYQNYDSIGDVPNMIFPTQTLEIPEDEAAVPDLGIEPAEETQAPAPERDLREEGADAQEPSVERGEEAGVEGGTEEPQEADEPVTESDEEAIGASAGIAVVPEVQAETETPPATETEAPSRTTEDDAFQAGHDTVITEVDSAIGEDSTDEGEDRVSPDHATNAQAASETPAEEIEGAAGEQQLTGASEELEASESFDLEGFKETFKQRIEAATPETMEAIESYEDDEPLEETEDAIQADIEAEHETTAGGVEGHIAQEPDVGAVETEEPEALETPDAGAEPQIDDERVGESLSTKPKSDEEVRQPFEEIREDLETPREDVGLDQQEGELSESPNDEWREAGEQKEALAAECEQAPEEYRAVEADVQQRAEERAVTEVNESTQDVHEERDSTLQAIAQQKERAKESDEESRQTAWAEIQSIYEETDETVSENLETMDEAEADALEALSERRKQFESEVSEIADDASGWFSGIKEFFTGDDFMDDFEDARDAFINDVETEILDPLIETVGECMENIETALEEGRERIEDRKEELKEERDDISDETFEEIDGAFDDLEQSATDRTEALSNNVTEAYEEELARADEHMAAKKEEVEESREGVIAYLKDKWEEVKQIWEMVKQLTSQAGEVVTALIPLIEAPWKDIGSNIIEFMSEGADNIIENFKEHLFNGLMQWLDLDLMRDADLSPPEDGFDGLSDFAGFAFDIAKALFTGGIFEYVYTQAQDVWSGEEVELKRGGLGLTDEQIENSSVLDEKDITTRGQSATIPLAAVFKLAWDAGSEVLDWLSDMGEVLVTVWEIVQGEAELSALLDHDTFKTVIAPLDIVKNLIFNALQNILFEKAMAKLAALAGPVGAIIKAAKKLYDFVMFIINNAAGMVSVLQGYVSAVHGLIVSGNVDRAVEIFEGMVPTFIATFLSFIASLAGAAGRASETVSDNIVKMKEKTDEVIDNFLLSKKGVAADTAPQFLNVLVMSSDTLVESDDQESESDAQGAGAGTGEQDATQQGPTGERSAQDSSGESRDQDSSQQDEVGDSDEGLWQTVGEKADEVGKWADATQSDAEAFVDSFTISADTDLSEVADKFQIEQKMRATDITVNASQGAEISESEAAYVLQVSELEHLLNETGASASVFVTEHARTIREGLVGAIAEILDKEPGEVWDGRWLYEHQSVAAEATANAARDAYKDVGADAAGYVGASGVEAVRDDRLGAKMDQLSAEQELRSRRREQIMNDPEWQDISAEQANWVANYEDIDEIERELGEDVSGLVDQGGSRSESERRLASQRGGLLAEEGRIEEWQAADREDVPKLLEEWEDEDKDDDDDSYSSDAGKEIPEALFELAELESERDERVTEVSERLMTEWVADILGEYDPEADELTTTQARELVEFTLSLGERRSEFVAFLEENYDIDILDLL